jgi:hypothetical protein
MVRATAVAGLVVVAAILAPAAAPAEVFKDCATCPDMVMIPT